MKKRENSDHLAKLANGIKKKEDEISEIKTKMAIESNELNVMGNEILSIENKIKELTQPNKVSKLDKADDKAKGDDQNKKVEGDADD